MRNLGVVAFARGDVNGDHIPDYVYVTGVKESDVSIVQNMTLLIQDGATGVFARIPLTENTGYDPKLFWVILQEMELMIFSLPSLQVEVVVQHITIFIPLLITHHVYCSTLMCLTNSIHMMLLIKIITKSK